MKLLITGGAGFIGSNYIRYTLSEHKDYSVVNLDKLTYAGNLENLKDLQANPNYTFIRGDICDKEIVQKTLADNVDAVINFAAETHVDRSIINPEEFLRTNIFGTHALLECARKYKIKRFIQISTDEVYGSLEPDQFFTEQSPLAPNSPYSASKAGADLLARAYYQTYNVPTIVTRCSNNYGPFQFPEKMIPLFISNALKNTPLPVYGDGLYTRDWIYVDDHNRAVDLVLHKGRPGEIYNIGAHTEKTTLEMAKLILKILGKPENLIQLAPDRPGHDRRYAIDPQKIKTEFEWQPLTGFDQGIRKTIAWYVNNQVWVNSILNGQYKEYYQKMYTQRSDTLKGI